MCCWYSLPTELLIDIVNHLPSSAVRALAATSRSSHSLCLPALFANVILPSAESLHSFALHVPRHYGQYILSLSVCTERKSAQSDHLSPTDALVTILSTSSRLQSLALSLASSLDPLKIIPAFAHLKSVHTFDIRNCGSEEDTPLSERLAVSLAASLPSLAHLRLSRISRSAACVDLCDVPYNVPIAMHDFDIPLHPRLGADLALPSLLTLPTLRVLEIRDTWLGADSKLAVNSDQSRPCIEKLLLTGNMYTSDNPVLDNDAYTAWVRACGPSLHTLVLGTALAPKVDFVPLSPSLVSHSERELSWDNEETELPPISHLHIDASLVTVDTLSSTMEVLSDCGIARLTISYGDGTSSPEPLGEEDEFARQCALDDLEEWRDAIEEFLQSLGSGQWHALRQIEVAFGKDVRAMWEL
ncbi:hypothetical protein EDC04DRAFT_927272 [Pisolithus marmoratus]|nr:hypothetical protein EDC04DRAFT_927272 [Pisolithus marmoratus]